MAVAKLPLDRERELAPVPDRRLEVVLAVVVSGAECVWMTWVPFSVHRLVNVVNCGPVVVGSTTDELLVCVLVTFVLAASEAYEDALIVDAGTGLELERKLELVVVVIAAE